MVFIRAYESSCWGIGGFYKSKARYNSWYIRGILYLFLLQRSEKFQNKE
jgi:hypothetical protein